MSKDIRADDLSKEVAKIFQEFAKATNKTVEEAVKETCQETVKELQNTSPKDKGNYAKSWKYGPSPFKKDKKAKVVYNKEHYQLTHLLELGHKLRGGGEVDGQPHIEPARNKAEAMVVKKIKEGIAKQ